MMNKSYNKPLQVFGLLGVDNPINISHAWCPKREESIDTY